MENTEGHSKCDFYAILGLNNNCTSTELRNAYKKLALRWHPDRCSDSEMAKKNFQAIQRAYSVLSDSNKRFLYDVGAYDSDDEENGMAEFLSEMVDMMDQVDSNGNREESFEEFKELFDELFQDDLPEFRTTDQPSTSSSFSSSYSSSSDNSSASNSHNHVKMTASDSSGFNVFASNFCLGVDSRGDRKKAKGRRRYGGVVGNLWMQTEGFS